jgi:hypothetical protein
LKLGWLYYCGLKYGGGGGSPAEFLLIDELWGCCISFVLLGLV